MNQAIEIKNDTKSPKSGNRMKNRSKVVLKTSPKLKISPISKARIENHRKQLQNKNDANVENNDDSEKDLDNIDVAKKNDALKYLMMNRKKFGGDGTSNSPRTKKIKKNGHSVHASWGKSESILEWIKKKQNKK